MLSLESHAYQSYDDLERRLAEVVEAAKSFIDTDFFTRVGVRYVNALPYDPRVFATWINADLVLVLKQQIFGDVSEFQQQIRGTTEIGGFLFQHGLGKQGEEARYMLDLDFYAEDVEVGNVLATAKELHRRQFDLFMWAIGPAALAALEKESPRA